jgi:biotin carboxyl carrier protein
MRKFIIKVNGSPYEVEVEEVFGATAPISHASPVAAPAAAPIASTPASVPAAPKAAAPAAASAPAVDSVEGTKIPAPMPGTILDVRVSKGDNVKKGDVMLILEAMKMENEIIAPLDGTIAAINVNKGDSINANQVMIVIA